MSRNISDINAKIAYLTNKRTGPLLKIKDPLVISSKVPGIRFQRSEGRLNALMRQKFLIFFYLF